jgi:hypothetical protein
VRNRKDPLARLFDPSVRHLASLTRVVHRRGQRLGQLQLPIDGDKQDRATIVAHRLDGRLDQHGLRKHV